MAVNHVSSAMPNDEPAGGHPCPAELVLAGLVRDLIRITEADALDEEVRVHGDRWIRPILDGLTTVRDEHPLVWAEIQTAGEQGLNRIVGAIGRAAEAS